MASLKFYPFPFYLDIHKRNSWLYLSLPEGFRWIRLEKMSFISLSLLGVRNVQLLTIFVIFCLSFIGKRGVIFWDKMGGLSSHHNLFWASFDSPQTVDHDEGEVAKSLPWWLYESRRVCHDDTRDRKWVGGGLCVSLQLGSRIFTFNAGHFSDNSMISISLFGSWHCVNTSCHNLH